MNVGRKGDSPLVPKGDSPLVPDGGGPIRVIHLVTTLAIGGLEKVVLDLVRLRTRPRFAVRVICLDSAGELEQAFAGLGVPVDTIGTAGPVPARILRLARRLRQLAPDLVHTHDPQAHLHGGLASRLAGVPAVVHTRHGHRHASQWPLAVLSRLATRWTSRFVAVSEDVGRMALTHERVPADKLSVIHNGIDIDRFAAPAQPRAHPVKRAVTVGRLDPVKDQASLLRAVSLVVREYPAFRLDIVGDGPSRPALEAERAALGLESHVYFHGYHEDVSPFLTGADVFVLSSLSEGVSLALLEAMATGLPVVATDVGGNREVVVQGESGRLVPPGSPEALASALLGLLTDAGERERAGRAARQRVEREFDLRDVVRRYEHVYEACLDGRIEEIATSRPAVPIRALEGLER